MIGLPICARRPSIRQTKCAIVGRGIGARRYTVKSECGESKLRKAIFRYIRLFPVTTIPYIKAPTAACDGVLLLHHSRYCPYLYLLHPTLLRHYVYPNPSIMMAYWARDPRGLITYRTTCCLNRVYQNLRSSKCTLLGFESATLRDVPHTGAAIMT